MGRRPDGPGLPRRGAVLGAIFLRQAYGLWRRGSSEEESTAGAIRLYKYSISYLTLLFAAVAVDSLVLSALGLIRREAPPDPQLMRSRNVRCPSGMGHMAVRRSRSAAWTTRPRQVLRRRIERALEPSTGWVARITTRSPASPRIRVMVTTADQAWRAARSGRSAPRRGPLADLFTRSIADRSPDDRAARPRMNSPRVARWAG